IRDLIVTGVQTCALPISPKMGLGLSAPSFVNAQGNQGACIPKSRYFVHNPSSRSSSSACVASLEPTLPVGIFNRSSILIGFLGRSEERRVGKECRSELWL